MIEGVDRRHFLRSAATASATLALSRMPDGRHMQAPPLPEGRRRIFEITTRIEILQPSGPTRVWVPTPLAVAPYQETLGDTYHLGEDGRSVMVENEDVDMLVAEWPAGAAPALTLISRVATNGHAANLTEPTVPPPLSLDVFARFLRPTRFIPTDGIGRSHFPRSQNDRLRYRRYSIHARVEESERKVRRPEFTLRRTRPSGRVARA